MAGMRPDGSFNVFGNNFAATRGLMRPDGSLNVFITNAADFASGNITSVFGRTGVVVAATNDYTFAQIGSKPTTLSGYGITDAQGLDAKLTFLTTSSSNTAAAFRTLLGLVIGTNVEAQSTTLDNFAAYNTNGLITQTAANTFTGRTITGTANRTTIINGNGVSGNPTIDINTSYVGQSTITTLGTVITGTWNGTTVALANGGTGGTSAATAAVNLQVEIGKLMYPVGCIYFSTNSTNPATSLGFGTWSAFGAGEVPVGFSTGDSDFGTDEATGGEKTHVLTLAENGPHTHDTVVFGQVISTTATTGAAARLTNFSVNNSSGTFTSTSSGSGTAHNNLQPFVVVRMWKRTA